MLRVPLDELRAMRQRFGMLLSRRETSALPVDFESVETIVVTPIGGMAERFKAPVLKTGDP